MLLLGSFDFAVVGFVVEPRNSQSTDPKLPEIRELSVYSVNPRNCLFCPMHRMYMRGKESETRLDGEAVYLILMSLLPKHGIPFPHEALAVSSSARALTGCLLVTGTHLCAF